MRPNGLRHILGATPDAPKSKDDVDSGKTLEEELAEQIRAAIREARPGEPSEKPAVAGDATWESMRRAELHWTPSVPPGARLFGLKTLLLRLFRFLWRDQTTFNAAALEALRGIGDHAARLDARLERLGRDLAEARGRAAVQDARFALLERVEEAAAPRELAGALAARDPELPPAVYSLFEERFRGSPQEIARSQAFYVSVVRGAPGPVLDVGCGRGEFLAALREAGIGATGVDSNPISVHLCREAGLDVREADALGDLAARPPASLGAVVALQVVEHWSAAAMFGFLVEARRALKPDGIVLLETINTDSLSALRAFFLDPTHVRPVPPAALAFLAEAAGFTEPRIELRSPVPDSERLEEITANDAKLNRLLFAAQDYALVARVPRPQR